MTSKLNIMFFFIAMVASILHSSTGQTTHIVGDFNFELGWRIPQSLFDYSDWASEQNFVQGDILVFHFLTGLHNVAEVSRTSYDACNITESPISIVTNGPANIILNSAGEHYYICTFPTHCDAGMKLAINVSAAASTTTPPPQPTASSSAPVPSPSRTQGQYVVDITPASGYVLPPPSPSTTSKFVVGSAMLVTWLSIAFILLY